MVLHLSYRRFVLFCFGSERDADAFIDDHAHYHSPERDRRSSGAKTAPYRKHAVDDVVPEGSRIFGGFATIGNEHKSDWDVGLTQGGFVKVRFRGTRSGTHAYLLGSIHRQQRYKQQRRHEVDRKGRRLLFHLQSEP
jgi:hypothetical protein